MMLKTTGSHRRGTILPLVVLCMVAMCGFVGLAIDIGMIAVAKGQCQNSADAAAMAGARTLDGTTGQNLTTAQSNATTLGQTNKVLTQTGTVSYRFGAFHYDTKNQLFVPQFPPVSPDNYNLCEVTVSYNVNTAFAPVFKYLNQAFNPVVGVTAVAQAAHRPRDVCIILDYSGSMNNESDLWNCESYLDNAQGAPNNPNNTSNNAETVYPLFGHYSKEQDYSNYGQYANLLCPAADNSTDLSGKFTNPLHGNALIGKSNVSQAVLGMSALVGDFWQNDRGGAATAAFSSASDTYATAPAGDNFLHVSNNSTTPYASNVNDITGNTNDAGWESNGYKSKTGTSFNGYTVGPRYWGATFFMWPPDPTNDWRKKYFFKADGTTPCNDNTVLFDSSGNWRDPVNSSGSTVYVINYKAILSWINTNLITAKLASGSPIFPPQMRSGNVVVYSKNFPTDVPASAYNHSQRNYKITDPDQRFWKEYIDWALGVWRDPNGNIQHPQHPAMSMGPDYTFGTVQIKGPPGGGSPYMDYKDNPKRPRHRMWFGPMTMIQFMSDTGLFPGTTHDISMFPMKTGVGGALTDIQNNHPNNLVSLILFSRPQYTNDDPGTGEFNNAQYNLTNDYTSMITTIWVPPGTGSTDLRLWDSSGNNPGIPSAHGDFDSNTASSYGFMLAYNQYSGNSDLSTAGVGGLGRRGSSRLIIFETDGMANEDSVPQNENGFHQGSPAAYNSYYTIMPGQPVNGAGYSQDNLLKVVEALCNLDTGSYSYTIPSGAPTPPSYPGYATPSKPVVIQCIAFGAIFETPSSIQTSAVSLLQMISTIGGTIFPSSPSDAANGFKWCIGDLATRETKLRDAFLKFLDSDVPVSLIK